MTRQFTETLNPLQPGWNPSVVSRATPRTGTAPNYAQPSGIRKDGVYVAHSARVHAATRALNPQLDGRFLLFDVVDFDSDNYISGQSQIDRLVVPVTLGGLYLIIVQADTSTSANNTVQGTVIVVNGSIGVAKAEVQEQGSTGGSLNAIGLWQLNDGDYVQVQYQDGASNPSSYLKVVEPGTPSLSILRIGG